MHIYNTPYIRIEHRQRTTYKPALNLLIPLLVITRATARPSGTLWTARDNDINWPNCKPDLPPSKWERMCERKREWWSYICNDVSIILNLRLLRINSYDEFVGKDRKCSEIRKSTGCIISKLGVGLKWKRVGVRKRQGCCTKGNHDRRSRYGR